MKTLGAIRAQWIAGVVASSLALAPTAYAAKPAKADAAASADKPLDKKQLADAKKHYGDGVAKYNAGDFDGALTEFQAADAVKQTPQAARYIGLCLDSLGRFQEAVQAYQRFLAGAPPKMSKESDEIKTRVAAIMLLPGKIHLVSDPPGAGVAVDGKPQPNLTPTDVETPPGHHVLHFTAAGHDPFDKDIDVTYASKEDVTVALPGSATPPPPPPVAVVEPPPPGPVTPEPAVATPAPTSHSNTAAWITGGAAVVAVGIGTAFGILALNDKSNFDSNPTTSTADSGENHALIADMAFGVAVTLGVTSVVLFLSHDETPAPAPAATSLVTDKRNKQGDETASAETPKRAKHQPSFSITPSPFMTAHGGGAGALIRF